MKNKLTILGLMLCLSLLALDRPALASNQIKAATSFYLGHSVMSRVLLPWAEELRLQSGGLVDIRFYNPGTLLPEREHFNATRRGELGLSQAAVGGSQGQLPITSLMDLPSLLSNCLAASEAFWRLYESSPEMQAEFDGIKVLAVHAMPPCQINLSNGNISALSDFKNQKILTTPNGDSARLLRLLGLNPLITPPEDFAGSLARGMADGCLLPLPALRAENMAESLKSITLCDLRMDSYWLGMNMEAYKALPDEARKALDELSGLKLSVAIARVLNDLNNLTLNELSKEGLSLNTLIPEERERWLAQISPPLREGWLAQLKRRQINNGGDILNRTPDIFREAEAKWGLSHQQQISSAN